MSAGFKEDFRSELEAYFIERLEKMQTVAIHGKRVMVNRKDNILVRHMYGELDSRSVKKVAII
jgi:histone H3/H4